MAYTVELLRGTRSRDGLLWSWGEAMAHGYHPTHRPADPDRPRLAVTYDSRPPCPDELIDCSLAFAALHDSTIGLYGASLSWFAHTRDVSRHQLVIYAYYVAGLGLKDQRARVAAMSPERRQSWLDTLEDLKRKNPDDPEIDDADGDELVALCIPKLREPGHISRSHAANLRTEAIGRMCAFLNRRPRSCTQAA